MIKIIDKYLFQQFIQTIFFGLMTFAVIFVIIDLMENLDDFIDENVPGKIIIQFYIVFIPEILRLMMPVAVLLASLFVAGKMSNQNELTALKAAGVSLYRFMTPFVITSLIISVLSVYFGGYIVPEANKQKVFIERTYMNRGVIKSGTNIFFQDSKSRIVSIGSFNVQIRQANRVSIQEFNPADVTQMVSRLDAVKMRFDTTSHTWKIYNGTKRTFTYGKESLEEFSLLDLNYLNFTPDEVVKKQTKAEEMTLPELEQFAEEQLRSGNNPRRILIDYHSRYAFAFASFVVVLFGLPISSNKRKGGLAIQFGINVLITFVYLVFMQISKSFGKNGLLEPILTAWFANIVFFIAAIINLYRTSK
jgi:lipopolysaccharide export system permease protein